MAVWSLLRHLGLSPSSRAICSRSLRALPCQASKLTWSYIVTCFPCASPLEMLHIWAYAVEDFHGEPDPTTWIQLKELTLVADQKRLSVPRGPVHIHDSSPSWTNVKMCQGLTQDNITVPTIGFACLRFGSQKTWFLRLLPITSSYLYHSISISISIAISLSVYLPTYLSTNLPIYLSIYLSIHLSTCPSIHLSTHPSIHPSM